MIIAIIVTKVTENKDHLMILTHTLFLLAFSLLKFSVKLLVTCAPLNIDLHDHQNSQTPQNSPKVET